MFLSLLYHYSYNLGAPLGLPLFLRLLRLLLAFCCKSQGESEISNAENIILTRKKIRWYANERLTFSDENETTRIEITFMI